MFYMDAGATAPWPSLLLSKDIPDARISAFGYDADVTKLLGQAGQNTIRQHAKSLLAGLSDMRFETNIVSGSSSRQSHKSTELTARRRIYQ